MIPLRDPIKEKPVVDVPQELLAEVPAILADLFEQKTGYSVRVIYLPDLKAPESAHVVILNGDNKPIDTITDLPLDQVMDAFRYPQRYSGALRDYLNGTPAKK